MFPSKRKFWEIARLPLTRLHRCFSTLSRQPAFLGRRRKGPVVRALSSGPIHGDRWMFGDYTVPHDVMLAWVKNCRKIPSTWSRKALSQDAVSGKHRRALAIAWKSKQMFVGDRCAGGGLQARASRVGVRSSVAGPKIFWGGKNPRVSKCLILSEQHYFVWDTGSQSTKMTLF